MRLLNTAAVAAALFSAALAVTLSMEGPTCISRSAKNTPSIASSQAAPAPSKEAAVPPPAAPLPPQAAPIRPKESPAPSIAAPIPQEASSPSGEVSVRLEVVHKQLNVAPEQLKAAPMQLSATYISPPSQTKASSIWSMEGPTCISRPKRSSPTPPPSREAPVSHNEAPQLKNAPVPLKASSVSSMEGPTCISRTRKNKPTPPPKMTNKGVSLKSNFKFSIKIHIKFEIVFVGGRAWAHFLDIDLSDSFSYRVVFTDQTRTDYYVESCLPEERNTVIIKAKSSYEYMGCTGAEQCKQKIVGTNGQTTIEKCSEAKCRVNVACRDGTQCSFENCDTGSGCDQVRVYNRTTAGFSIRTLPEHPAPPRTEFKACKIPSAPLPVRQVFRFSNETWIENIAVRRNGDLLLTQMQPNASLYALSNSTNSSISVKLIHTFSSLTSLSGIAEISEDVFFVIGFNFSSIGPVNGSAESWIIDFRAKVGGPSVKRIAKHPEMVLPNGVAKLPSQNNTVLISDSVKGLVWRLSVDSPSPKAEIAVQSSNMIVAPDSPFQVGVNGIKVEKNYLYWSNSFQGSIYRLRIDGQGKPEQNASDELVHRQPEDKMFIDDFTYDDRGLWGATNLNSTVFYAPRNKTLSATIAGKGSSVVSGATACAFGRMQGDAKTLYVVTGLNGTVTEGGKVVAIGTATV